MSVRRRSGMRVKAGLKAGIASGALLIAAAAEGRPVEWVQLLPFGVLEARDGRRWSNARDDAAAVITASLKYAGNGDPVVDYDHQADQAAVPGVGGRAPASGWIKQFEARDDGIYGRVEWTAAAAAAIEAREYRYISPVFQHDRSGKITRVIRAALTNKPALDLAALASEQIPGETMDMAKIAQALGLGADATEEQVLAAIAKLSSATAAASELTKVRAALKLGEGASGDDIVTAIASAAKPSGDANEAVVVLQTELNQLKTSLASQQAEGKVDAAVKAGKIIPAARLTYLAIATETPHRFDELMATASVVIDPAVLSRAKVDPDSVTLTDDDIAMCSTMGLDQADFLKTKKENAQ